MMRSKGCLTFLVIGVIGCSSSSSNPPPAVVAESGVSQAEVEFSQGIEAATSGNWSQAVQFFDRAARLTPSHPLALVNLGIALEHTGDLLGAEIIYREAMAKEADHQKDITLHLARVLTFLGKTQSALVLVESALARAQEDSELTVAMTTLLRLLGRASESEAMAQALILREPKNVEAWKSLALVYADRGQWSLAETLLQSAHKLSPDDVGVAMNLAMIFYKKGSPTLALSEFNRILQEAPDNALLYANIGALALAFRDYDRASEAYRKANAVGLRTCATRAGLGFALQGQKQAEPALEELEAAYALCPSNTHLLFTMGHISLNVLRDNARALVYFERYVHAKSDLKPDDAVFGLINSLRDMSGTRHAEGFER